MYKYKFSNRTYFFSTVERNWHFGWFSSRVTNIRTDVHLTSFLGRKSNRPQSTRPFRTETYIFCHSCTCVTEQIYEIFNSSWSKKLFLDSNTKRNGTISMENSQLRSTVNVNNFRTVSWLRCLFWNQGLRANLFKIRASVNYSCFEAVC